MKFPQQFVAKSSDLFLTLLTSNDTEFILSCADHIELGLVFGSPTKKNTLADLIKADLSWIACYLISDHEQHYGIIKIVPELDNFYSFHGIGWSEKHKISKKYIFAWYAIHHLYFKTNKYSTSNSLLSNSNGLKALTNIGYTTTFMQKTYDDFIVNFQLSKIGFIEKVPISIYQDYLFEEANPIINIKKTISTHEPIKRAELKTPQIRIIENTFFFKSAFIKNRLQLDLKKTTYTLKYKSIEINILEVFFNELNHYHLEVKESTNNHDYLIFITLLEKFFINKTKGIIFLYNSEFSEMLFIGNYAFLGRDSLRKRSAWSLM